MNNPWFISLSNNCMGIRTPLDPGQVQGVEMIHGVTREEAIERTTYTTILALPWFWQFWNGALIVVILNPLMCPLMPLGWLWRASKSIKVSFCLERMNYWKGDFYVLYCPNQNVLYKSPSVFILFIEVNRKRNKRRLYKQSEPLLTILKGLNLT